jgi:hypothetical protein
MSATIELTTDIAALRAGIRGSVVTPQDERWDEARATFNVAVDQHPAVVVEAVCAEDVALAVRYARSTGRVVSAQAGGHGAKNGVDDVVLVRTNALRDLVVDPEAGTVSVGAGIRWGDVMAAAAPHGLIGMCGSSPDVGVVGFAVSGGISWFARRHGFAANHVLAVELVTPEGEIVSVDADSDPDLFWAVRGGGGNFGIVTALSMRLHRAPAVYGGLVAFGAERSVEVLKAWRAVSETAPLEAGLTASVLNVPPLPELPAVIRGRSLVTVGLVHLGTEAEARALLAPVYAAGGEPVLDLMRPLGVEEIGDVAMDPSEPLPYDMRGTAVEAFDDGAIAMLAGMAGTPMVMAQVRLMGGAIAEDDPRHGAAGALDGRYLVYGVGLTPDEHVGAFVAELFGAMDAALAPQACERRPLTFAGGQADARSAFGAAYDRLAAIKRDRDPDGIVRGNIAVA